MSYDDCVVITDCGRSEAEAGMWTIIYWCLGARTLNCPHCAPRLVPGPTVDAQQMAPHLLGCVSAVRVGFAHYRINTGTVLDVPAVEGAVREMDSALVPDADRPLTLSVTTAVSDVEIVASDER